MSIYDETYPAVMKKLKRPAGTIMGPYEALVGLRYARQYLDRAHNAYHQYQTRGPGTMTGLKALARHDACSKVGHEWLDALEGWISVQRAGV